MNEENILEGFELVEVSDQVENANNILDGFELVEDEEVILQPKIAKVPEEIIERNKRWDKGEFLMEEKKAFDEYNKPENKEKRKNLEANEIFSNLETSLKNIPQEKITEETAKNYFKLDQRPVSIVTDPNVEPDFYENLTFKEYREKGLKEGFLTEEEARFYIGSGSKRVGKKYQPIDQYLSPDKLEEYNNYQQTGVLEALNVNDEAEIRAAKNQSLDNLYKKETQLFLNNVPEEIKDLMGPFGTDKKYKNIEDAAKSLNLGREILIENNNKLKEDYNSYIEQAKPYQEGINNVIEKINNIEKNVPSGNVKDGTDTQIKEYQILLAEAEKLQDEYEQKGLNTIYDNLAKQQKLNELNLDKFSKDSRDVQTKAIIEKQLGLDYSLSARTGMALEEFFVGGLLNFGSLTSQLLLKGGKVLANPANNAIIDNITESIVQTTRDYNSKLAEKRETTIPDNITLDDIESENVNFFDWFGEALANNSPSIITTFVPGTAALRGASLVKAAKGYSAMKKAAQAKNALTVAGTRTAQGIFFIGESGGRYGDLELQQGRALENLPKLKKQIEEELDPTKKMQMQEDYEDLERISDYSFAQKAFTSYAYGTAATLAETLGSLKIINGASKLASKMGKQQFKAGAYASPLNFAANTTGKAISGISKNAGKAVAIEEAEETLTQVAHNLIDILALKENKSIIDGIDKEFLANTAVTSFAIMAPKTMGNTRNMLKNEFTTREEILNNQDDVVELIQLQEQFKALESGPEKTALRKRRRELLNKLAIADGMTLTKLNSMTNEEVVEAADLARQMRQLKNQMFELGRTGELSEGGKKARKQIEDQYNSVNKRREDLLNKRLKEDRSKIKDLREELGKNFVNLNAEYYFGLYDFYKNVAMTLMPKDGKFIVVDTKNKNWRNDLTDLSKEELAQVEAFVETGNNAVAIGNNILINENVVTTQIGVSGILTEAGYAAAAPIEELFHIQNKAKNIVDKDGMLSEEATKAVDQAIEVVKNKFELGKISEQDYNDLISRFNRYKTGGKGKVVLKSGKRGEATADAEEIMAQINNAVAIGALSLEDIETMPSLKDFINGISKDIFGDSSWMFDLKTANDVFNFIKNYQSNIQEGVKLALPDDEDDIEKASKAASDNVQKIYEDQGVGGALDIIEEFKPIVNKIVQRRSEAPNFDRQLLTDEIETGKRGLLELIQDYDIESGVPLAAYINKFLPARAIEASRRVLGESFTEDISQRVDIAAPEVEVEVKTKEEKVPRSLRKKLNIEKGSDLYNKVKDAVVKTFGTKLPEVTDPKFKKALSDSYKRELKKEVNALMGTRSDFKMFVTNNAETLYKSIPQETINKRFQAFSEPVLDKEGKQVREKTAVGKGVFKKKPFNKEEFINYFLGGDVGASTKGTRKTALSETIADEMALDATLEVLEDPKVFEKFKEIQKIEGKKVPKDIKPKISEKVKRPEGFKFSKSLKIKVKKAKAEKAKTTAAKEKEGINAEIERQYGGALDKTNPDDFEKFEKDIVNIFADELGPTIFSYITSQTIAAAGNNAFGSKPGRGAIGAGFFYITEFGGEKKPTAERTGETASMLEAGYIGEIKTLENKIKDKYQYKRPLPKDRIYTAKTQTLKNLKYNKENLSLINKEKRNILDKWKKIYDNYPKSRPSIKEFQYNNNANAAVSKNEAFVLDSMDGATEFNKYEEHGYQHGEYSLDKAKAMSSKVDGTWEYWKDYAEKEYKQMVFNKTTKIPSIKGDMRTYQGIVDLTYNLPQYGEWKAKSQKYPLVSEMMNIAMKTGKKSDWNKVPPASDMRFFNEVIKLNPFILKTFYNDKTISFAEKYKLKVPKKFENDPNVYQLASDLIFQINKTKAGKLTGDLSMDPAKAQNILDNYLKIAPEQQKAAKFSKSMLNDSRVLNAEGSLSMQDLLSKAASIDEALKIARDPNAPVKKIRVFDFDDTLAKSKSLVFYNRPNDSGKPVPNNKAIFMIGGPGSGKSNIGKGLQLGRDGWKVVNQDIFIESEKAKQGLSEIEKDYTKEQRSKRAKIGAAGRKAAEAKMDKYTKAGNGMVIDGTGASYNATMKKVNKLKEQGYEVFMVHAKTSNEVALERNRARKERSLPDFIVEKTQESVNNNIGQYKSDLGDNFIEIDTETIEYGKPLPKEFVNDAKARFYATERGKLNAEEFAEQGAGLIEEGFAMDFSDFNIVREGEKGPLFDVAKKIQKARGTDDVFVLTARAPESQQAIYEFLKSEGLEIPLENITGLGNSTGEAKANWLVNKAAEGYNDFYFADDAYQNVKAVKDAMSVLDVKSKVQQAKVKFSKSVNKDFNKIIEQTTGIASEKVYSEAKAKVRGANKGNKKFFIPYSAEDFMGLIYPLLSKGKLGDSQMAWFKKNLLDPYAMANENLSTDRLQLMEDFKTLKKALDVPKDLRKKTDSGFTKEQAVRVYLFNKAGFDVPGISKTDLNELLDLVNSDGVLKAFADQIFNITKGDGYAKPGENWLVGTITTDLIDVLNTVKRAKYLEQSGYTANAELIFSKENLNKLEAAYGSKYREAMENILGRMKSGKNRIFSGNRLSNRVLDYINNSTGAIMFFNTRSAVLQTISAINFLNWSFNNPIKAGAAFANQKQYWKDFVELINSDYLVDRRNGLKLNINESEIADAAATSKNKAKAAINYILQKGFLPTQYADSFAIASGGATFYRNRINDLVKNQGMSEADAKKQAMLEWRQTAEISQQSSDPSKISAQQASDLGRVILAFANTPMQYARIQKRAVQDLANGRGDAKTHVSKIIYYAVVQNLIFNALQSALFKLGFDDEEDEKKEKMYLRTANGMLDSQLRGLGLAGATVAVIKNFLTDIYERSGRKRPEYVDSIYKLLQISPPVSSKISKIRGAAWQFDSKKRREEIFKKGFSIDNPAYEAGAKVISATANIPLDRVYSKVDNISGAMSEDAETWQTIAMLAGWPKWQIMPDKKEVSTFNKGNVKVETKKDLEKKLGVRFL